MRVVWEYEGRQTVFDVADDSITIGRRQPDAPVDIDLTPDLGVSRRHARMWRDGGSLWIEDLGSRFGTLVAGQQIKGEGRRALVPGEIIELGESVLRVDGAARAEPAQVTQADTAAAARGAIVQVLRAGTEAPPADDAAAARRLALLYALPVEFARQARAGHLFESVVQRLIGVIPGAQRAALLVRDRATGNLLLKAHEPAGRPSVSVTLAGRAMTTREAFVWNAGEDLTRSQVRLSMLSAMYAPLVWNDEPLGVVCVDNHDAGPQFDGDDLELLAAVARYAAIAVMHRELEDDLARHATVLSRLLTNFSPQVRDRLLAKADRGRLRLGGERSEVTILCSDIRGFTRMTAAMDADDTVDMLNEYFSTLVGAIFTCDGTIDKFVGDAILAVFGSPEPDAQQHEKAVRAAVAMQAGIAAVNERRRARGLVTCDIGIGLHCGEVVHGFIGSAERMEFTVIGDPVNFAARYCDGAKGGEVLLSPALYERVWRVVDAEAATVPTKHEGDLQAFRVTALK